jgi:DNA-binding MarR family transcriptional regulator
MAAHARKRTSELIDLHRRHWAGGLDLEVASAIMALHRADDAVREFAKAVWARHGLTPAEFDVLATLRRSPPPRQLTPSEIQEAMLITSGGLTKAMASLEAKGLISRSRSEADQRIRPVKLSAGGKRTAERVMAELTAATVGPVRAALQPKELQLLTALLGRLDERLAATGAAEG